MIELAVFDLDGTLLETLSDMTDACNYTLNLYAYPSRTAEEIRLMVGYGVRNLIKKAIPQGVELEDEDYDKFFATYQQYYSQNHTNKTKPYDGIDELLKTLIKDGMKVAVLSNKIDSNTKEIGKHFFPYLDENYIFGQREGVPIKPDPTALLELVNMAGATKDKTVYIGDSEADMKVAVNAGITPVGVTWGFRDREVLEESGAKFIVESSEELLEIIRSF